MFWQPVFRLLTRNSYKSCVSVSSYYLSRSFKIHVLPDNIYLERGIITDLQQGNKCLKLKHPDTSRSVTPRKDDLGDRNS